MGKKLYVGNLPYSITEQTLTDAFSKYGTVESVKIIKDRDTGRSKGFGFVEMSTEEEAQDSIHSMNGTELDNRTITVNESRPMAPRDSFGGGGQGRGSYRNDRGGGNRW